MTALDLARRSRRAARELAVAPGAARSDALLRIADLLVARRDSLLAANALDLKKAAPPSADIPVRGGTDAKPSPARQDAAFQGGGGTAFNPGAEGISEAFRDRLTLTEKRIAAMADGVRVVSGLTDPVGAIVTGWTRPNGLRIEKVRVPIGVILVIYESRPNVTADAAALTLKSGNAVILRGGKEAFESNRAIAAVLREGLVAARLPEDAILFVERTGREFVGDLLKLEGEIDVVIPRGGEGLIRTVVEQSRIPVVYHGAGICHVFVDASADLAIAERVIRNAKCSRPGVCNAMETLLVHRGIASEALPRIAKALFDVELRGDGEARAVVPEMKVATEEDWRAEYLAKILAVRVVGSVSEAIDHIETYGSHLADAIITRDVESAERFTRGVDSAAVYVNASTRFTDGGEFGLGAEIGISTQKLHARGPMGPEELTTVKYVIRGEGQIRE